MVKTRGSFQSESDSSTMAVMPEEKHHRQEPVVSERMPAKALPAKKTRRSKPFSKADLIKGTGHIHFHENIKMPTTHQAKKKRGNNQYTMKHAQVDANNGQQPEVVKMATGNLFIFREPQRRVVFVRNK